jgi:hypothetical protein
MLRAVLLANRVTSLSLLQTDLYATDCGLAAGSILVAMLLLSPLLLVLLAFVDASPDAKRE